MKISLRLMKLAKYLQKIADYGLLRHLSNDQLADLYMKLDPDTFLEVYHPGYN